MSRAPTSARIASERASAGAISLGCTLLQSRLMAHVAGRGRNCWETDGEVRDQIERYTGRRYHRESIGRARRILRDRGLLESIRIFMGTKPKGAKWATSHGTTEKRVRWNALGMRDPRGRAEQRRARDEQPQPHRVGSRYAQFPPSSPVPAMDPAEAKRLAELAIAAMNDDDATPEPVSVDALLLDAAIDELDAELDTGPPS